VLIYIVESCYERDATLKCVESWKIIIVNKKKIYDTTLKIQDRHNKSKQKLTNIKKQMISLQELANNLKKKLRLCNEKINRLQDSLAIA
jgi:hypothetical protein